MPFVRNLLSAIILVLTSVAPARGAELWACGAFNSWKPNESHAFRTSDGVHKLTIDFSRGRDFKISTVDCGGISDTGEAWSSFDTGAYDLAGETSLNVAIPLKRGKSNITAPEGRPLEVVVDLDGMTLTFSDGGEEATPYSGTLPVMFIATEGGAPVDSKETYVGATYYIDPMGCAGVEALGSASAPLGMRIRGRGNYTWTGFEKKPYRLKFDEKASPLGMNKSRHFALLAHADDTFGFLRNPVGFRLSEMIGLPWTPAQQPVEVMLNGSYIGLYFLTETIRVAKDRVAVAEQADDAAEPSDVTGGWLVEIDNYADSPHVTVSEGWGGGDIWFTYKSPESLSASQRDYLTEQMTTINALIYGDATSPELWEHVDLDALVRYYIVQEIVDDYESFHGSCYLHKDVGEGEKWKFGPVWDFGNAFSSPKGDFIDHDRVWHQVWIGGISRFPAFQEKVREVWRSFSSYDDIYGYVRSYASTISEACEYDARRWPRYGNANADSEAAYVISWLKESKSWLSERWGEIAAGVAEVRFEGGLDVRAGRGAIVVTSAEATTVGITSPSGFTRVERVGAGETSIATAPGLYFVEGRKLIVK